MRIGIGLAAAGLLLSGAADARPAGGGMTKGVANAVLAAKARSTPVKAVDYNEDRCDPRSVEQWLKALTGANARSIAWTGGPCQIVGMGIDGGSSWCAQATITLAHPKSRRDQPMIEIFFERPVHGRPGAAYAFRGAMTAADGEDTSRFRKDFEADWTSRFAAPEGAILDCQAE
ncbi:MAG: hypothetical protein JSR86_04935 [Proteobacteria bacterium]|nr:hypothetical protein [Pseudomonadota bacterium]